MPRISLVVCLHRERDLLERLLRQTAGLFDDLVVVHDGPEYATRNEADRPDEIRAVPAIDYSDLGFNSPLPPGYGRGANPAQRESIHELTTNYGGRYFEGPRCFQQEPHWPFAWSRAENDWILRLDADEFPSAKMKDWLKNFRNKDDVDPAISGYTCIWPIWDGEKAITSRWPVGRNFLFNRKRVRFFGMAEQTPIPDGRYEPLSLILNHQPKRKSHGMRNVVLRKQARIWQGIIARSLMHSPQDLSQWRWGNGEWPEPWARLRQRPLQFAVPRFFRDSTNTLLTQWREEKKILPCVSLSGPCHRLLIAITFRRVGMKEKKQIFSTKRMPDQ